MADALNIVSFVALQYLFFFLLFVCPGPIAESPKPSPVTISTLKEKIKSPFGKGKIESTRKIQLMLEETLTKNIQLQQVSIE